MTHRVRSAALAVALGATALLGVVLLAGSALAQAPLQLETAGPGTATGLWVARLVNHLALAATVGLLLVPAWLLAPSPERALVRRTARLAAATAVAWAMGAAGVLVFGLSNAAARPLPEALQGDLLGRFVQTRFGTAILLQILLAAVVAFLAAMTRGRSGAVLALGAALLGALAPAWWGHAGTASPRLVAVVSDWAHIGAASVWVGGLLAVTAVVLPRRSGVAPYGPAARFSDLAGWSILVVAATGVVNTLLHVDAPGQLVDTTWGRTALAKAVLLLGLAGFGWAHRRRTMPRLRQVGDGPGARRIFARLAGVELLVMLLAVGLATSMASGLPASAEAAARIQTFTADLGEGFAEVTLDPARAGVNELHLYLYDADRRLRDVDGASVRLHAGDVEVAPRLVRSGPGHFTGPSVQVPAAGPWSVHVRIEVDGAVEEAVGTLAVR